MKDFCELNSIQINVNKIKIVVFSKGKIRKIPTIYYGGYLLNISHSYNYLGILSNYNGSFKVAQKELYDKGTEAMLSLIGKLCRKLDLPIDIQIKLFNSLVKPIVFNSRPLWPKGYCRHLHLSVCLSVPIILVNTITQSVHQTCWVALIWHYLGWYCKWAILVKIFLFVKAIISASWAR